MFNYRDFTDLKEKYLLLLEKHTRLQDRCDQLQRENTNLKIRLRIEEARRDEI